MPADEWSHVLYDYDGTNGANLRQWNIDRPPDVKGPVSLNANIIIGAWNGAAATSLARWTKSVFSASSLSAAEAMSLFQLSLTQEQADNMSENCALRSPRSPPSLATRWTTSTDYLPHTTRWEPTRLARIPGNLSRIGHRHARAGLNDVDGQLTLLLDVNSGTGLQLLAVPEPASIAIWSILGVAFICGWTRLRKKKRA